VLDDKKLALARSLLADRNNSPAAIAAMLGVSRATVYRYAGASVPTGPAPPPRPVKRASAKGVPAKSRKPATSARARTYA
jgi:transposase